MFKELVDNYKRNIVENTIELIKIPSVLDESSISPSKPFGEKINTALEYILDLGKTLGFKTKNIDGYCGYIECGSGKELIGIATHLDVVPAKSNWNFPPFEGIVDENKIYGRGVIDDKGPTIASLYAMKIITDNFALNKRIRLIVGLNEENDWKCINYYKEHEEIPSIGFSPDADFPCIYTEKGVLSTFFKMDYSNYLNNPIVIKNFECNNNAINVVADFCSVTLEMNNKINMVDFIFLLNSLISKYEFNIDFSFNTENNQMQLNSYGIASHASHPELGTNAISRLLIILNDLFENYNIEIEILDFFKKHINTEIYGDSLGLKRNDESGDLTLNVGNISFENNFIIIGLNLRIPVFTKLDFININFDKILLDYPQISYYHKRFQEPLFLEKDSFLIKTLCKSYNEVCDSNLSPISIGGATFARAFKNFASFGPTFPNDPDMCHQTDEFVDIDKLLLTTEIYTNALFHFI